MSDTLKPAPGPWVVAKANQRRHYQQDDIEIQCGYRRIVATLYAENWSIGGETDRANACLIAAAPEMLEALRQCRDHGFQAAEYLVNAAIAKAEGPK
jgi:hypothetical protein